MKTDLIEISVPGRICLFGKDLDYTGLEVITAAINLRMHVKGTFSNDNFVHVKFLDIKQHDKFPINKKARYRKTPRPHIPTCPIQACG